MLKLILEHDPQKWIPVLRAGSCLNKELEPHSDSIGMEKALVVGADPDDIADLDAIAFMAMAPALVPWVAAYFAPLAPNPFVAVPTGKAVTAATVTAMHLDDIIRGRGGGNPWIDQGGRCRSRRRAGK